MSTTKPSAKAPVAISLLISKYQSAPTPAVKTRWKNQLIERRTEFQSYFQSLGTTEEQQLKLALPFLFN